MPAVYYSLPLSLSGALVRERSTPTERCRRSAKLVPTFADRGVSRGKRNGSPRPLIFFIEVAPQLTSRG